MRVGMIDTQAIRKRWETVGSKLDERGRRVFAAGEARAAGWGGLDAVFEITGIARPTIGGAPPSPPPRRSAGGGGWGAGGPRGGGGGGGGGPGGPGGGGGGGGPGCARSR